MSYNDEVIYLKSEKVIPEVVYIISCDWGHSHPNSVGLAEQAEEGERTRKERKYFKNWVKYQESKAREYVLLSRLS